MGYKSLQKRREYAREWRKRNIIESQRKGRIAQKKFIQRAKYEALFFYSNGALQCACCGEDTYNFLGTHHIHGGGTRHKRERKGKNLYVWLKRMGFPPGYEVMCMNCNFSIGHYGYCPHELQRMNINENRN